MSAALANRAGMALAEVGYPADAVRVDEGLLSFDWRIPPEVGWRAAQIARSCEPDFVAVCRECAMSVMYGTAADVRATGEACQATRIGVTDCGVTR